MLHGRDTFTTLPRQFQKRSFISGVASLIALGCGDNAARAPNPTGYDWPQQFSYHLDYVSETQQNGHPILHLAETKTTRFAVHEAQYFIVQDRLLKTVQRPGEPLRQLAYAPEDTLGVYASLGRRGEITRVQLACDPALPACAAVLLSSVVLELRRFIPRLPVFEAPRGATWDDTLEFDDTARPRGTRGAMLTRYTGRGDTLIGGRWYWVISWHSTLRSGRGGAPQIPPTLEDGMTFVEKARLVPAYATWAGAVPGSAELRAIGVAGTGYRGRAYLAGSVFDSLYGGQIRQ